MITCHTPAIHLAGTSLARAGLSELFERVGAATPVAVISAGWQEWEGSLLPMPSGFRELHLHRRAAALFGANTELREAHRSRQARLIRHQSAYSLRLSHAVAALDAIRQSAGRGGAEDVIWNEHEQLALNTIRLLDRQHLRSARRIQSDFHDRWNACRDDALSAQHRELAKIIADSATVLVAGGHVAVLLNRMRLFDLPRLLTGKTLIAWGAGAMAMSEKIMLFDDRAPQGARVPEILEDGLGMVAKTILLPDAHGRLDLENRDHLRTLAMRSAPQRCIALGDHALVTSRGGELEGRHAHRISAAGRLRKVMQ